MRMKRLIGVLVSVILITWGTGFAETPPTSDDARLQEIQRQLNEDASALVKKSHAETLAKQFQVEVKTVEQLRASKQGWGEIAIRMGLAQELVKTDPKTYPTMTEALQKVGDLRAQGNGWGAIAKDLGFKLGPVISEVRHVRNEMRAEIRKADFDGGGKRETARERFQIERGNKDNGMERAERIERPERMEKAERPERPERPQRPERPDRPERAEK